MYDPKLKKYEKYIENVSSSKDCDDISIEANVTAIVINWIKFPKLESMFSCDPLQFWYNKRSYFDILYKIALKLLALLEVSERIISLSNYLLNKRRTLILYDHV